HVANILAGVSFSDRVAPAKPPVGAKRVDTPGGVVEGPLVLDDVETKLAQQRTDHRLANGGVLQPAQTTALGGQRDLSFGKRDTVLIDTRLVGAPALL